MVSAIRDTRQRSSPSGRKSVAQGVSLGKTVVSRKLWNGAEEQRPKDPPFLKREPNQKLGLVLAAVEGAGQVEVLLRPARKA